MKLVYSLSLTIISVLLLTSSCKKFEKIDFQEAWNPDLAIPLAYSTFGVYDVLARVDSSDILINDPETGAISLVYNSVIASLKASDLFGNISFNESYVYTTPALDLPVIPSFSVTQSTTRTEVLTFNGPNGEEIDHMKFKSGFFNFNLTSDLRQDIEMTITFPKLLDGSTPVTRDVSLDYQGSTPMTASFQIDLTGLTADFTLNGTDHNKLEAVIVTTVIGNISNPQGIDGGETINIDFSSQNMVFSNIDGFFGQTALIQQKDSVLIRIYQNTDQVGHFELKNPSIKFYVNNSFGIPIDLYLNNLKTINTVTNQQLPLAGFPSPLSVQAPASLGQNMTTTLELNNDNTSNLSTIISPTPKYFYYEANAIPNPQGDIGIINFVDETSQLEIRTEVNLPLEGFMYGFFVQDTVPFKMTQNTENIEAVLFRLIGDNGFPVDVSPTIKAVDDNFNEIFSLFNVNEKIIEGAPVDANGKVITDVRKITDINLTPDKMAKLKDVTQLIIRAETNTSGYNASNPAASTNVKFFDSYKLKLQLSMNVKYQTN